MNRFALSVLSLSFVAAAAQAQDTPQERYDAALAIVDQRADGVPDLPRAVRLLQQVVEDPAGAGLSGDAEAYLQWIAADLQVRFAVLAHERGNTAQAIHLLRSARRAEALGPEALQSIDERIAAFRAERRSRRIAVPGDTMIREVGGKRVRRAETIALRDPESGEEFFVHFRNPATPRRGALLALLAAGGGERAPAPAAEPAASTPEPATPADTTSDIVRGATNILNRIGR